MDLATKSEKVFKTLYVLHIHTKIMVTGSPEYNVILTAEDELVKIEKSRELLRKSGAHYVIDSIVDLPEIIEEINQRLKHGERP
jgi:hypothetical protein